MIEELAEIARVMGQQYGKDISAYDPGFLEKSVERRLAATGLTTPAAYGDYLRGSAPEAETLFRSLNITHSEFFRNSLTFAVLERVVLPTLSLRADAAGRAELRIWSAACAAGQEAYSLAMMLHEHGAARGRALSFRIFATDRSEAELASARAGVYDDAAVQNVRLKHLRDYFTRGGESYRVVDALRDRVDFSRYDLLDDHSVCPAASIYGDFDLVFCGNLLFYYRPEIRRAILTKLYRTLSPNGYLVTGEAERDFVEDQEGYRAVAAPSSVFQKTNWSR